MWKFSLATNWNASRCLLGGLPASAPAMSNPTTPASRCRTASSAISSDRAAVRMAVSSAYTVMLRPRLPRRKPSSTASTTWSRLRPPVTCSSGANRTSAYTTPSAARSSAHSAATRISASPGLHHADRVLERLQVELELAALGHAGHPALQLGHVGRGQAVVPGLARPARRWSAGAARRPGGHAAAPWARCGSDRGLPAQPIVTDVPLRQSHGDSPSRAAATDQAVMRSTTSGLAAGGWRRPRSRRPAR